MSDLRAHIERHRVLEAAATEGPWWDNSVSYGAFVNAAATGALIVADLRRSEGAVNPDHDAALIALDRNVISALLDVAEAAQDHGECSGCGPIWTDRGLHAPECDIDTQLLAALAALTRAYEEDRDE